MNTCPNSASHRTASVAVSTVAAAALALALCPAPANADSAGEAGSAGKAGDTVSVAGEIRVEGAGNGASISESPGTLLSATPVPATKGQRIRYTSENEAGETVDVGGTLYDTPNARGLIALAPGTRGMGDHCAPSAATALLSSIEGDSIAINYEAPIVGTLIDAGYRVVVTDYIGLGGPGTHTYLNRIEQGHALIDAARATVHDGEAIAFWGYSQGGGASAAAAELVADYAPELDVRATFSGAPPADPINVMKQGSTNFLDTVVGYATVSYAATYPDFRAALDEHLTAEGREWLAALENHCVTDQPIPHGDILKEGRTLPELSLLDERFTRTLNHNKLGTVGVPMPILVMTTPDDDLVPEPQVTQLAKDYAQHGSDVTFEVVHLRGTASDPLSSGESSRDSATRFINSIEAGVGGFGIAVADALDTAGDAVEAATGSVDPFDEASDLVRASSYPITNTPVAGHAAPLLFNSGDALKWLSKYMPPKNIDRGQVALTSTLAVLAVLAALVPVLAPTFWPEFGARVNAGVGRIWPPRF